MIVIGWILIAAGLAAFVVSTILRRRNRRRPHSCRNWLPPDEE